MCSVVVTAVVPQRWHRSGALNKLALLLITVRLRTCQMLHACGTMQLEVERLSPMSDHSSAQASAWRNHRRVHSGCGDGCGDGSQWRHRSQECSGKEARIYVHAMPRGQGAPTARWSWHFLGTTYLAICTCRPHRREGEARDASLCSCGRPQQRGTGVQRQVGIRRTVVRSIVGHGAYG